MTLAQAPVRTERVGAAPNGSPFRGWEEFIAQFVHPAKVAIVEALLYIGEPLSAAQFAKLFGGAEDGFREPNIRHHLRYLVEAGVLEAVPSGPFGDPRGMEKFVYFARRVAIERPSEPLH